MIDLILYDGIFGSVSVWGIIFCRYFVVVLYRYILLVYNVCHSWIYNNNGNNTKVQLHNQTPTPINKTYNKIQILQKITEIGFK